MRRAIPVSSEFNGAHIGTEFQFSNAFVLIIVPYHDFIWGIFWVLAAADQSKDVAAKKHLDYANSTICSKV